MMRRRYQNVTRINHCLHCLKNRIVHGRRIRIIGLGKTESVLWQASRERWRLILSDTGYCHCNWKRQCSRLFYGQKLLQGWSGEESHQEVNTASMRCQIMNSIENMQWLYVTGWTGKGPQRLQARPGGQEGSDSRRRFGQYINPSKRHKLPAGTGSGTISSAVHRSR